MKQYLAIFLSIIALMGVLVIVGVWVFGSLQLSVVSLDTFIGVSVALLSVIFMVIIGWQVINAIQVREEMGKMESRLKFLNDIVQDLAKNDKLHSMEANNLQSAICQMNADSYLKQGLYVEAFAFYTFSLNFAIEGDTPNQSNNIKQMQLALNHINAKPTMPQTELFNQIKYYSEKIRNTGSYKNCLSGLFEETVAAFWQKMKSLGCETNKYE